MSAEFIFKESQKEFALSSKCSHPDTWCITLPTINKIDKIDVKCNLVINKVPTNTKNKYFISLWFESKKILYCGPRGEYILYKQREKLHPYTSNKINQFLLKAKNDVLPNLKLDKVFGKFILVNKNGKKNIQEANVGEDIFGFEYSNYSKCSVCYESTYTHTGCNHPLCVSCWNQIKNDSCPICRNALIMHNEDGEDEEDEEDEEEEENNDEYYYHYMDIEEDDEEEEDVNNEVLNNAFIADEEDNNSTDETILINPANTDDEDDEKDEIYTEQITLPLQ